mmetsp:Transcript_13705/g.43835  ORF Transcript_13705/g.43835 Transcript_13705/m.43835 type:complete len:372 (-) Transcript_13705:330-1445(-)
MASAAAGASAAAPLATPELEAEATPLDGAPAAEASPAQGQPAPADAKPCHPDDNDDDDHNSNDDVWAWLQPGTLEWRVTSPDKLVGEDQLRADFDHARYSAREPATLELAAAIEETWAARVSANPRLFNGTKFRLASVRSGEAGSESPLWLGIGLTDYRRFLGTNCAAKQSTYDELLAEGRTAHADERACIADPLGVGVILVTSDTKVILIERSHLTGEYQGFVDPPAGHCEPKRPGLDKDPEQGSPSDRSAAFRKELFWSILDEIVCEVNIPVVHLSAPRLCAILRQQGPSRARPNALFFVTCDLNEAEIRALYNQGGEEKDESVALLALNLDDLRAARRLDNINGAPLTPQTRVLISLVLSQCVPFKPC